MKTSFVLISVLFWLAAGPTLAQSPDVQSLAETVSRLERQLQTLERNIYRSGGAPAPSSTSGAAPAAQELSPAGAAQLSVRVGEIEEQLRQVTGDVERLGHDVRQMSSRLETALTDIDFRLRSIERGVPVGSMAADTSAASVAVGGQQGAEQPAAAGGSAQPGVVGTLTESQLRAAGAAPAATPQAGAVETASAAADVALPPGEPAAQYEYAFSYLMRRDFHGAEEAFRQFVAANPDDSLAGNAQYWLGETFYVRNDFPAAARAFAEGFQRYPDSGKAADNLLKLGLSLAALDRKDDACITFAKLSTSYPGAPANILQRAKRERDKLGCG